MGFNHLIKSVAIAVAGAFAFSGAAHAAEITGAGASFPYPVYAKWAELYKAATGNSLNYQSIGSGGGIKQIKAKTVDFGASDAPLPQSELAEAGLTQFPAVVGGVVPVVNLDGVTPGQIKLSGQVLGDIYAGKITKWNAAEITALNPGVKLPNEDITVVYRSDASGTSYVFTSYLSKANADFKSKIGAGTAVKWPTGVGGKGNEGVAANVQKVKGAIGYVEYAYVKKNKLNYTQLKNKDGNFVSPDDSTFKAATAAGDWAKTPGFAVDFTDAAGKESWPISSATFILLHKEQAGDGAKGREVLKFFDWAYKNGGKVAAELDYVPLPDSVTKLVEDSWKSNVKDSSGKALW
ncbi:MULTISPECIES: phosphate ABC transporter substrate-binding protein PstS [Herbaspirillum]|jgi:phosphate transport system substrate-binding protein|uniref:phosphate ABC transporter substrate-binding protein PstS n=1 Tax=Herbaspirillum TaxID=963 RepID=UPI0012AD00DA|nr:MULTISPECIES: phosphate ABC transporter substrate-binding protein PstS [Herbaspirillum]MBW9336342.1 phosphate ABC transporter substrate-binding protein PstS [Herbaspirillum sp. RU 5E]MRT27771.1 phosphate ABC transporter substrate-binding protein PstS [Herbaspirillum sp. CAH-3]